MLLLLLAFSLLRSSCVALITFLINGRLFRDTDLPHPVHNLGAPGPVVVSVAPERERERLHVVHPQRQGQQRQRVLGQAQGELQEERGEGGGGRIIILLAADYIFPAVL